MLIKTGYPNLHDGDFLNLVPRAFSSTIFKMEIVEEKALGTRLVIFFVLTR